MKKLLQRPKPMEKNEKAAAAAEAAKNAEA